MIALRLWMPVKSVCDCGDGVSEVMERRAWIGCEWRWYGRVKVVMGLIVFVFVVVCTVRWAELHCRT